MVTPVETSPVPESVIVRFVRVTGPALVLGRTTCRSATLVEPARVVALEGSPGPTAANIVTAPGWSVGVIVGVEVIVGVGVVVGV